ncbi:MAG TPA: serine/threonine-protein kinase, partial [Holophagaceae bacterium]|nr:serine/threonine-protein kinase [Holophagaceae bacterium]
MPIGPGTQLGPYEITSRLGSGGMGEVFRAWDPKLDRFVAIKVLSDSWRQDPSFLARFEREAKVLASLNHPNIVSIFDFGEVDGRTFAVMELLEGRTLRQAIAEGPLPLAQAAGIGAEVAHGLAAAHRAGIIHRDLKPENIFLTASGPVKLLDFGLAKKIVTRSSSPSDGEPEMRPTSTNAGVLLGTVGYMAPEQLQADGEVDGRSDLFALGCVLYEMVVGVKAFASETPMGTLHAILTQDPDFERIEMPSALREVLRHCLAKPPDQRFQDAQDLAYALETFRRPFSGAIEPVPRPPSRRGWVVLASALAGILMLVLGLRIWISSPPLPAFIPLSPYEGQVLAARFDAAGRVVFALRQGDDLPQVLQAQPGGTESAVPDLQGMIPLCRQADGSWLILRGTRRLDPDREVLEGDLLRRVAGGGPVQTV